MRARPDLAWVRRHRTVGLVRGAAQRLRARGEGVLCNLQAAGAAGCRTTNRQGRPPKSSLGEDSDPGGFRVPSLGASKKLEKNLAWHRCPLGPRLYLGEGVSRRGGGGGRAGKPRANHAAPDRPLRIGRGRHDGRCANVGRAPRGGGGAPTASAPWTVTAHGSGDTPRGRSQHEPALSEPRRPTAQRSPSDGARVSYLFTSLAAGPSRGEPHARARAGASLLKVLVGGARTSSDPHRNRGLGPAPRPSPAPLRLQKVTALFNVGAST